MAELWPLRPVHTSAVVFFAFLVACTDLYWRLIGAASHARARCGAEISPGSCSGAIIVHRHGSNRLFAGHQTQSKGICRAGMVWIVADGVWVAVFAGFSHVLSTQGAAHLCANWFFLSFIVTVAHAASVSNGLPCRCLLLGSKSYSAFSAFKDALTQWWYGHNAVGFF